MKPLFTSPTLGPGKLVRNGVLAEIEERGGTEPLAVLPPEERLPALKAKLMEEAYEVANAKRRELRGELADVLQVCRSLAAEAGIEWSDVLGERIGRESTRGDFAKGYFLRAEHFRPEKKRSGTDG